MRTLFTIFLSLVLLVGCDNSVTGPDAEFGRWGWWCPPPPPPPPPPPKPVPEPRAVEYKARINLSPSMQTIHVGETLQMAVLLREERYGPWFTPDQVRWAVFGSAGTIDQSGVLTGKRAGTSIVRAFVTTSTGRTVYGALNVRVTP